MVSGAAIDHQAVLEAIPGSHGIISNIAKKCGHSWHAVKGAIKENPILTKAYDAECEASIDKTENKLHEMIEEGDAGLIKWHLGCKGKHRGWGEKVEVPQLDALTEALRTIAERQNGPTEPKK